MAAAPSSAELEAITDAPMKLRRRPYLLITMAAGMVPAATPTTIKATGKVAQARDGSIMAPMMPPKSAVIAPLEKEEALATASNQTLREREKLGILDKPDITLCRYIN